MSIILAKNIDRAIGNAMFALTKYPYLNKDGGEGDQFFHYILYNFLTSAIGRMEVWPAHEPKDLFDDLTNDELREMFGVLEKECNEAQKEEIHGILRTMIRHYHILRAEMNAGTRRVTPWLCSPINYDYGAKWGRMVFMLVFFFDCSLDAVPV